MHPVAAARRLGGLGAEVTLLSLAGLPDGEWIDLLLDRLPLDAASRGESIKPWLKLENHLRENAILGRPVVLLFDDIDRAPADARAGIGRIAASAEPRFSTTVPKPPRTVDARSGGWKLTIVFPPSLDSTRVEQVLFQDPSQCAKTAINRARTALCARTRNCSTVIEQIVRRAHFAEDLPPPRCIIGP